jgi:hypothetical protein
MLRKTLLFIKDAVPTQEELDLAKEIGEGVAFRNVLHVPSDGPIEQADDYAGAVPERYAAALRMKTLTGERSMPVVDPATEKHYDPAALSEQRLATDLARGSSGPDMNPKPIWDRPPLAPTPKVDAAGWPVTETTEPAATDWQPPAGKGSETSKPVS